MPPYLVHQGGAPAKTNWTTSFGSTTASIWNEGFFSLLVGGLYLVQCNVGLWSNVFAGTTHVSTDTT